MKPTRFVPVILVLLLLIAEGATLRAEDKQSRRHDTLEALVAQAVTANPEVKASEERWRMSVERPAGRGT